MTNRGFKERLSSSSRAHPARGQRVLALTVAATLAGSGLGAPLAWAEPSDKDEAAAISQVAGAKAKAGEFAMCAALFQQAYAKDPSYLAYLFSAARCAQKAGDLDAAERDFRTYLARCPKGDKLADKAQQYLGEILEERRKAPPAPAPSAPAPQSAAPNGPPGPPEAPVQAEPKGGTPVESRPNAEKLPDATPQLPAVHQVEPVPGRGGLWLALGGVALLAGGAVLWSQGQGQASDLEAELGRRGDGLVLGMSHAEAQSRQDDANRAIGLGIGLAATGALLAAAGGWWWLSSPGQPEGKAVLRLGPGPAPLGLALQWAVR